MGVCKEDRKECESSLDGDVWWAFVGEMQCDKEDPCQTGFASFKCRAVGAVELVRAVCGRRGVQEWRCVENSADVQEVERMRGRETCKLSWWAR